MSAPLLQVEGLGVQFPRGGWPRPSMLRAAHEVSFTVNAGEVVALVGESGSGKSTIGKVIARLQQADTGNVLLDGESLAVTTSRRARAGTRAKVQMIFQDPYASLNPVHTILHHIARPLRLHGCSAADVRARAVALLEAAGLSPGEDFVDRKPNALSGGQRQRVAIARALAPDPRLLVADEPTASLDVSVRMEVLTLLRRLQTERQMGVLLITHDLAGARWIAAHVVVLYAGQIMEQGPTEHVLRAPRHPYTRLLVAAAAHTPGPLPGGLGPPPVVDPPPGCPFAARCPVATVACHETLPAPVPVEGLPRWQVRCHNPL